MPEKVYPTYPIPLSTASRILLAGVGNQKRSFHEDGRKMIKPVQVKISGDVWIPTHGRVLLTINHFYRIGFGIWWAIAAVSANVEKEICWIMTSNWTYPGQRREKILRPLSHFIFDKIASIYGFITIPPMPPHPSQIAERALAVRKVMAFVRQTDHPIIGLSPEGMDFPLGRLGNPPPGSGRFVYHLVKQDLVIVPVGIYEEENFLRLNFGPHYRLCLDENLNSRDLDSNASRIVMGNIAALLPQQLRGEF